MTGQRKTTAKTASPSRPSVPGGAGPESVGPETKGEVTTRLVDFPPDRALRMESGAILSPLAVAYETYGRLNPEKDNAVLVCHALSGDAHAAGYHGAGNGPIAVAKGKERSSFAEASEDRMVPEKDPGARPGWWDLMIGPGKPLDTDRYFVICSNFLGSCYGTTGPSTVDSATGHPYGLSFPFFTVRDMVEAQRWLLDHLGVDRLHAVIGGSLGGMQALEWAIRYPDRVEGCIPIATTARMSAQGIALNEVARQAIIGDPRWKKGRYGPEEGPDAGLALARMMGHITYLSEEAMHRKFGRRHIGEKGKSWTFEQDFQVEGYLRHQGKKFVKRFDANTYLYITRAMDYFDLEAEFGTLERAFAQARSSFLVVSFTSDWLFPPVQSQALVKALRKAGREVSYACLESDQGHDAFLLPGNGLGGLVAGYLQRLGRGRDRS